MKAEHSRTAYEAAIHILSYREQSEREIRKKLFCRGYGEEDVEDVVDKLKECGYINDRELAEDCFDRLRRSGRYGDAYIHHKMKLRGLYTDEHMTAEEEFEAARKLLQKKEEINPGFSEYFQKAMAFLGRRGFSGSVSSRALKSLKE